MSNPPKGTLGAASLTKDASPSEDAPTLVDASLRSAFSGNASDAPTLLDAGTQRRPGNEQESFSDQPILPVGKVLGERYQIVALLGQGGMGAVYKAIDRELSRPVALKVIRPDLAQNPSIIERFKQELLLAREVTHRNVIRIYDLGEADRIKFITMEFVEGEDLRSLLERENRLAPEQAIDIIQQICRALEAAHIAGIIHRDLKPQNVMRDRNGRIVVMDFGLARTVQGDGMTQTGALVGTMDYMSPEQALGKSLDQRSDLYTVGLIFYELLTGKMPFAAESTLASLIKRTQECAAPVSHCDPAISASLSNIVSKCLERDVNLRYQETGELLADLDAWQGNRASAGLTFQANVGPWGRDLNWPLVAALATVLVLAAAGFLFRNKLFVARTSSRPSTPVSVLVADFQNNTSDSIFDGTLEPMFNAALEGASFVNAFNRGTARQLASKLPSPTTKLDEQAARLVALSQGINTIVTGELSLRSGYRLSVEAVDAVTGKSLATADIIAANKDDLLLDIPKLAIPLRKALGDTTPESVQLAAQQGSFTASNLEAVHEYSMGMEQQFAGNAAESLKSFSKAVELDPNFARAYVGMAGTYGNLDQPQNAEKYAKLAMEHIDRMTERERYRVRGQYYIRTGNWQKCIEEYGELVQQYPADNAGENNLATCYAFALNMPRAMEEGLKALKIAPKDIQTRINYTQYACYASDFESCEQGAREVLQLNSTYEEAFIALAYAQVGENQLPQAEETYKKLEKVSAWGASLAALGRGCLALYQGRLQEAIQILEKGAAADLAAKKPDAAADKFLTLAYARLQRGDKPGAKTAVEDALANGQTTKIRFLAGRILVEEGEIAQARKRVASFASEIQTAPQAYGKLIQGEAALKEHNPRQAIQLFTEAKDIADTWIGRFDLGRAYLDAGAFTEADSEFDRCIRRRGEASEFFMDDMPTYNYIPMVYYYEGRVREGLKSPGFTDSYHAYLNIRGQSTEDPLVADIRHRLQ